MFCTRCGRRVPEFLWIDNDHPVLAEESMILTRDPENLVNNTVLVKASIRVHTTMCSELYLVSVR
jgi:hypothetical protein